MKASSISPVTSPLWQAPYSLGRQPALCTSQTFSFLPTLRGGGAGSTWGQPAGVQNMGQLLQEGEESRRAEEGREAEGRAGTSETESICLH